MVTDNITRTSLSGNRATGPTLSLAALSMALMASVPLVLVAESASAGTCTEPTADNWVCSGAAGGAGNDALISISDTAAASPINVSEDGTFGQDSINVTGTALDIVVGAGSGDLSVDLGAASITGQTKAVSVQNNGNGTTNVQVDGALNTGATGLVALYVVGSATSTDLSFTTGAGPVFGGAIGVYALQNGTGATSVTVGSGGVSSTSVAAVYASDAAASTSMNIVANGAVSSVAGNGIQVLHEGSGTLLINTYDGDIFGGKSGIDAASLLGTGGNVVVNTRNGNVTGADYGIHIDNAGATGATTTVDIAGGGKIIGQNGTGVDIVAHTGTGNIGLTTGTGSILFGGAAGFGIHVHNEGAGTTTIQLGSGDVGNLPTNTGGIGIQATANNGRNLTLTGSTGAIGGGQYGIFAGIYNGPADADSGALDLSVVGDVTGGTAAGLQAYNYTSLGSSTVTTGAGAISGGTYGIKFSASSAGLASVQTGAGNVTGTQEDGILAEMGPNTGALNLVTGTGSVMGGVNGINVKQDGSQLMHVTTNGDITGGTGSAINLQTVAGGTAQVNLQGSGAAISAASGTAITDGAGNTDVFVRSGALLVGDVALGDGNDQLIFDGASLASIGTLDAGVDFFEAFLDVLTLDNVGTNVLVGANLQNWDSVQIEGNSTISFSDHALSVENSLRVLAPAVLDVSGGGMVLSGALVSDGTITMVDGIAGDVFDVSGYASGIGTLMLDVDFGADNADTMLIGGNLLTANASNITLNDITSGAATGHDIVLVDVTGNTAAGDFVLANGPVTLGVWQYDLGLVNKQWLLQGAVTSAGAAYEASPSVLLGFADLSSMEQRVGQRQQVEGQAIWGRISGDINRFTPQTSTSDFAVDAKSFGFQSGIDGVIAGEGGRFVLGVNASYGALGAAVTGPNGSEHISSRGFGLGATATYLGDNGFYVDTQGRVNWIRSDFSSDSQGVLVQGHRSQAYALSVEAGARLDMGNGGSVVPQAQLSWSRLVGGSFTDSAGHLVDLKTNDRLMGRIGVAVETETDGNKAYVLANVLHDFAAQSSVSVAASPLDSLGQATWGEVGFGGSLALSDTVSIYGEASYKTTFGGNMGANQEFSATGGVHVNW